MTDRDRIPSSEPLTGAPQVQKPINRLLERVKSQLASDPLRITVSPATLDARDLSPLESPDASPSADDVYIALPGSGHGTPRDDEFLIHRARSASDASPAPDFTLDVLTQDDDTEVAKGEVAPPKRACRQRLWPLILRTAIVLVALILLLTMVAIAARADAQKHFDLLKASMSEVDVVPCSTDIEFCRLGEMPSYRDLNGTFVALFTPEQAKRCDILPEEAVFLGTVFNGLLNRNMSLLEETLRGAHIVVRYTSVDHQGWVYKFFTHLKDAYTRRSSHRSSLPQYGIPEGRVLKTLLVGESAQPLATWFQLEGAEWNPWQHPFSSLIHVLNYLQYKITGRQVGPLGTSIYTDRHPIVIDFHWSPPPVPPVAEAIS